MNKRKIGKEYEDRAAQYLQQHGYRMLERNFRIKRGEIDLIAESPDGIVCYIEVKYRSSLHFGDPLEAVTARKQNTISAVAVYHYSYCYSGNCTQLRFDVIGIYGDGGIRHVQDAFPFCFGSR